MHMELFCLMAFIPTINEKLRELPGGIWIGSLNEAAMKFGSLIEKHYGKYAKSDTDGLIHLNTAMASDGVFVYVPEGQYLKSRFRLLILFSQMKICSTSTGILS